MINNHGHGHGDRAPDGALISLDETLEELNAERVAAIRAMMRAKHQEARAMLGAAYEARAKPVRALIVQRMRKEGCAVLAAAWTLAQKLERITATEYGAEQYHQAQALILMTLAAACEMIERGEEIG